MTNIEINIPQIRFSGTYNRFYHADKAIREAMKEHAVPEWIEVDVEVIYDDGLEYWDDICYVNDQPLALQLFESAYRWSQHIMSQMVGDWCSWTFPTSLLSYTVNDLDDPKDAELLYEGHELAKVLERLEQEMPQTWS
ncbi:hypothetical protein D3C75_577830 [compost metagenome]